MKLTLAVIGLGLALTISSLAQPIDGRLTLIKEVIKRTVRLGPLKRIDHEALQVIQDLMVDRLASENEPAYRDRVKEIEDFAQGIVELERNPTIRPEERHYDDIKLGEGEEKDGVVFAFRYPQRLTTETGITSVRWLIFFETSKDKDGQTQYKILSAHRRFTPVSLPGLFYNKKAILTRDLG